MPTYEYFCEANGHVLEVQHKMAERIETWGELCARAGVATDTTVPAATVTKLMSSAFVATGKAVAGEPMCAPTGCGMGPCGSSMCQLE